jgi:hypothetical protein
VLCALELIEITGTVVAGFGGQGGKAVASAVNGRSAEAEGGPGNQAGDVVMKGLAAGAAVCQLFIPGTVKADSGGPGGDAQATGGNNRRWWGGNATALGNSGAQGGTVLIDGNTCAANPPNPTLGFPPLGPVEAGIGGNGGDADANGGTGATAAFFNGWAGGHATATGGNGAKPGNPNPPKIPLTTGLLLGVKATPSMSQSGKGGDADATPGTGGVGGSNAKFGWGGSSGSATAQGGRSGNTGGALAPANTGPVAGGAAPVGVDGVGTTASSPGAP